ncbi:MAG: hypothetical protein GY913_06875 [Proteobacteria bacterium]|nr:hypothetical protein [Pseudomonadota bacterium]MCP4916630.1 hypothetical protein [Pseudomonadota bacterium]
MVLFALFACLPQLQNEPDNTLPVIEGDDDTDADSDADTDADSDSDTDPVEDEICDNGDDDDGDGKVDCEDEDCVDACIEDCDDGKDNDQDGATDCEDDECSGEPECGVVWDYELETKGGEAIMEFYDDAYLWMEADLHLEGTSNDGGSITCDGWFSAGPSDWEMHGAEYNGGDCNGCDWRFKLRPKESQGSLHWFSECNVDKLPAIYLGFREGSDSITADIDGGWKTQYEGRAQWTDENWDSYGWFFDLEQVRPRTWSETE